MFRRCVFLLTTESLLYHLKNSVSTKKPAAVRDISYRLSNEDREELAEVKGGLLQFLKDSPDMFDVSEVNGCWMARQRKPNELNEDKASAQIQTKGPDVSRAELPMEKMISPMSKSVPKEKKVVAPGEQTIDKARRTKAQRMLPTFMVPIREVAATQKVSVSELWQDLAGSLLQYVDYQTLHGPPLTRTADINQTMEQIAEDDIPEDTYIRILPPYAPGVPKDVDELYKDSKVEEYDAYRLARFLSTTEPTPLHTVRDTVEPILTKPVMHVLASYPHLFHFDPETEKILYVVHPDFYSFNAMGGLVTKSDEELAQMKKQCGSRLQDVKLRKKIVRELIRRRFPKGNPFLDPNVLAYYIYDNILSSDGAVSNLTLMSLLPENGQICARVDQKFLERYPHLFAVVKDSPAKYSVARANAGVIDDRRDPSTLSLEDIALSLMAERLPHQTEDTVLTGSYLYSRTPGIVQKAIKLNGGTIAVMKNFPNRFKVIDDERFSFVGKIERVN